MPSRPQKASRIPPALPWPGSLQLFTITPSSLLERTSLPRPSGLHLDTEGLDPIRLCVDLVPTQALTDLLSIFASTTLRTVDATLLFKAAADCARRLHRLNDFSGPQLTTMCWAFAEVCAALVIAMCATCEPRIRFARPHYEDMRYVRCEICVKVGPSSLCTIARVCASDRAYTDTRHASGWLAPREAVCRTGCSDNPALRARLLQLGAVDPQRWDHLQH